MLHCFLATCRFFCYIPRLAEEVLDEAKEAEDVVCFNGRESVVESVRAWLHQRTQGFSMGSQELFSAVHPMSLNHLPGIIMVHSTFAWSPRISRVIAKSTRKTVS